MSQTVPVEPPAGVSVVITAFNCGRYLGQAIGSVLGQTRPPGQVILLDDGSTDDCQDVAKAFGRAVEYVHQPNTGVAAARNAGARRSRLAWLAYLDGDDYWEPDKLERQLAAAQSAPHVDAFFGHVQQFISPELAPEERARVQVPEMLMPGVCAGTLLIRRGAFEQVGPFNETWNGSEFLDWYARAVEAGLEMLVLPQRLGWRRVHLSNHSRRLGSTQEYTHTLKALLDRRRKTLRRQG